MGITFANWEEAAWSEELGVNFLMHYGMPRRSGRYPWGSGKHPFQSGKDFLARVEELRGGSV